MARTGSLPRPILGIAFDSTKVDMYGYGAAITEHTRLFWELVAGDDEERDNRPS